MTMLTSTATALLTYPILTIYFWLSNKLAGEEKIPSQLLKETCPLKEVPLLTEYPQTINLFWYVTSPEFSGKWIKFQDFVSGLRIYFDLNKQSFIDDKEKVFFMMLYLQGEAHKFMMPNYDLYLQDKKLVA